MFRRCGAVLRSDSFTDVDVPTREARAVWIPKTSLPLAKAAPSR